MDQRLQGLCSSGFQLMWAAGPYCRICRDEREVLLRWDVDHWVEV